MKNAFRTVVFGIICAVLIVSFYFYLSRRMGADEKTDEPEKVSAMQTTLNRDLQLDYPGTPRAVIMFYNDIVLLYHDSDTSDEQLVDLCDQALGLFDEELLAVNPRDNYIAAVCQDVADYETAKKTLNSADVGDTRDVTYATKDGRKYAYVIGSYFITEGSGYNRVYQKYALRKDSNDRWKILAMQLCDKDGNPTS